MSIPFSVGLNSGGYLVFHAFFALSVRQVSGRCSRFVVCLLLLGLIVPAIGCGEPSASQIDPEKHPWLDPANLVDGLQDKDHRVRALSCVSLGNLGAKAEVAIPELEKLKDDPNPKVREKAAAALEKILAAGGKADAS